MLRVAETYEQAIEYLYGRINYERVHGDNYAACDFKLDRMAQLLTLLGDPQRRLPAIHIAGTKGKGSTAIMLSEVLGAAGFTVGLYTSPHIQAFEERMRVNGQQPSPEHIVDLVNRVAEAVDIMDRSPRWLKPTYFEIATAMACMLFEDREADVAIMEVGLGGRLDSTNLCHPEVCVITNISRDHTNLLGSDLAAIAREKAGIVKPQIPVVSGVSVAEARRVVEDRCQSQNAPLYRLGFELGYTFRTAPQTECIGNSETQDEVMRVDVRTPWRELNRIPVTLAGEHQAQNTALAVGVVDVLRDRGWRISDDAIRTGFASVEWPVRVEVVGRRPTVVVDAAHNWASVAALLETLKSSFPARRRILIFATSKDKDLRGMLRQLVPQFDTVILSQYLNNPRAVPGPELQRIMRTISNHPLHVAPDPASAWKLARHIAQPEDLICVTGSFFIASEVRELAADAGRGPSQIAESSATSQGG
jgi:dihydrofolate synthase / folylpolyglutamate synthase